MKKLFAILVIVLAFLDCHAQKYSSFTNVATLHSNALFLVSMNGTQSVNISFGQLLSQIGGGSAVSNAYSINLVVGTTYTNATPRRAMVGFFATALVTSNETTTSVYGSVDADGNGTPETTAGYASAQMVKTESQSNVVSVNLTFPVEPYTAFKINAGTGSPSVVSGYGWISYFTTNASGTVSGNILGNSATATSVVNITNKLNVLKAVQSSARGFQVSNGNYPAMGNSAYFTNSGVVRHIHGVFDVGGVTDVGVEKLRTNLRIYTDVGSSTNSPAAGNKDWDVPLANLSCSRFWFTTNGGFQNSMQSMFVEFREASTNSAGNRQLYDFDIWGTFPFTNAFYAIMYHTGGGSNWTKGYLAADVEYGTLPDEWSGVRNVAITYGATNVEPVVSNYLGAVTGSGALYATHFSYINATNSNQFSGFFDSHGLVIRQGDGQEWKPSGLDDYFSGTLGGPAGKHKGKTAGLRAGINNIFQDDPNASDGPLGAWEEAYRVHDLDPKAFSGGATFYNDSNVFAHQLHFTFFLLVKR